MINSRALILSGLIFLIFLFLVVTLFKIQVSGHQKYKSQADKQQNKLYVLKAERGTIKDRNGEILAYTRQDNSLFADCRMLNRKRNAKKRLKLAKKLSTVFKKPASYYLRMIKKGKGNISLEKKVSQDKTILLNNFVVDGFYKVQDYTRVYPYSNLASHVLGAVNKQSAGVDGVEKMYNKYLKGKDGFLVVENDVIGRTVTINYDQSENPVPGDNIVLTINKVYEKILEKSLIDGIKKYKGKSGIGIIMDPSTGEILALSNFPNFNPSKYNKYSAAARRDRVLTDTYEPGSTMKSIVMSVLLDKGLVDPSEVINTENGRYRIKGAYINDAHKYKRLTVSEVLEHSSNIGMVKLSERINSGAFYKSLRDFGFGNPTEIDLPGETKGMLKRPDRYSAISKAFISHGYEISVTPLQMITAYAALINGGYLLRPFTVKEIDDAEGNVIVKNEKEVIRRVITQMTSEKIKKMMLGVVESGTGELAQMKDVYVGGKTGTSQKLIKGRYSNKYYNSSFIGFLPVQAPKLICLILVDSPEIGRYGGQVAAPIFKNIMSKIFEVDSDIIEKHERIDRIGNPISKIILENEKKSKSNILSTADIASEYKERFKTNSKNINRKTMPNLKNMSLREAISILNSLKIKYKIEGNGRVVYQSINAGTELKKGIFCKIKAKPSDVLKSITVN